MKYLSLDDPNNTYFLDIETESLKPTIIWCCHILNKGTREEWSFYDQNNIYQQLNDFITSKPEAVWIGHNILSFDMPVLQRLCKFDSKLDYCIDTLTLSYLYNSALEGGHSLEAYGQRLKFPKGEHSDWSQFSYSMLEYCKNDVCLTEKVYDALASKMNALKFSELSCYIEHQTRIIINEQQDNGFYFNISGANDLYKYLTDRQTNLSKDIHKLFPPELAEMGTYTRRKRKDGSDFASYERHLKEYPLVRDNGDETYTCLNYVPFNIASPKQRTARLLRLGWEPKSFTETGLPKADEDALVAFAKESGREEVKAMAEWLVCNGRANMIKTWLDNVDKTDNRIHGKVLSCGATTRRMVHSSPNCVPLYSQALTRNGWRSYDQLIIGEDILAYDLETKTKKWTPILNLSIFPEAEIYSFGQQHSGKRLFCTKNHSWVAQSKSNYEKHKGIEQLIEAQYLKRNSHRVRINAYFDNDILDSFLTCLYLVSETRISAVQKRKLKGPNQRMGYNVVQTGNTFMRTKDMSLRYEGTEPVWCPTTKFGTWVMKQGDFITITGNTANIPSPTKAKYGAESRALWCVEPNKGLVEVGIDASGLENVGLVHYLDNPKAAEILNRPKPDDIHSLNARALTKALGREIDREWGSKTTWYAWIYGAYPKKLGEIVKGPPEDGETIIRTYFKNVPGLEKLINKVKKEWYDNSGILECIDGGFVRCPSENAALNYKIQSLGAILMKVAAIQLRDCIKIGKWPVKLLGTIHDEWQFECPEELGDELGKLAVWSIEEAGRFLKLNVPITGQYKVGPDWSRTH